MTSRSRWIGWSQWLNDLGLWIVQGWPAQSADWLQQLGHRQLLILAGAVLWLCLPLVTLRLNTWEQGVVAMALLLLGSWLVRLEERHSEKRASEALHLLLMTLSLLTTARYLYYRTAYTLNFDGRLNTVFCLLLFGAELYAIATLFLAYFQTLRVRDRRCPAFSSIPPDQLWTVDIYIPTYNEDVEIVRKTAIGALAIAYPREKKRVYILDDGRAEKFRERRSRLQQMCEELGCIMLTRDNNDHAKAGNINTAFRKTDGDLVLILDCDHIPARNMLQETVGFFLNPNVSLVQTPHWFYNPDPFERNLLTRGQVPVGNELFYKVLQKGNDYWNAAFFCGSAAVIRKAHVMEIGGIATETVTEDCHTSFRLHSLGYESVYYDKIMVAGLAPEKFSAYVGQQVRWARGMAQILRLENPLWNRQLNLTVAQRLCYFSATSHFFFGFPRLMYLLAPMLYLLLGINSVKGLGLETLFYALPHICLSMQTNHLPYKHVRFSFWNEIYEFAMSFQAGIVTLLALINPKLGSFNVTDKGLTVTKRSFDLESVRYLLILGVLSAASLLVVPFWFVLSPRDLQAVGINTLWCLFNLVLVTAACLVAFEQPQRRQAHRMPRSLPVTLYSGDSCYPGKTLNVSETGALILLEEWPNIPDEVQVELVGDYGERVRFDAQVMRALATHQLKTQIAVQFSHLAQAQADAIVRVLYCDVQEWYSQHRQVQDHPWRSLRFIASSLRRAFQELQPEVGLPVRQQVQAVAQLYWDGWTGYSFQGTITELSTREVRLEIDDSMFLDVDELRLSEPVLSLLVAPNSEASPAISLVAKVHTVEILSAVRTINSTIAPNRVAVELRFPDTLRRQQRPKLQQLLGMVS